MTTRRAAPYFQIGHSINSSAWIEERFQKCECIQFIQDTLDRNKCGCGREKIQHDPMPQWQVGFWSWKKHAHPYPTDSYGTVEFNTGVHAQYVRMSPATKPDDVVRLLTEHWGADPPKLVVSIHGGMNNFELPPKIKRAFRKSLQKMAAVPGCWILTSGLNVGISKHVGDALTAGVLRRTGAVVIGIAPWGAIGGRQRLQVRNGDVHYYPPPTASGATVLNPNHSYFLLVDDGSVGKYGQEVRWRHDFEQDISSAQKDPFSAPLIALFVEGGSNCIRLAVDYLTDSKPIVIIGESGRASNILSMAMQLNDSNNEEGSAANVLDENDLTLLTAQIKQNFGKSHSHRARAILNEVVLCTKRRKLATVWTVPDNVGPNTGPHLDVCMLSCLLTAKTRSASEQLRLALAWNRVDLASNLIFTDGQQWPEDSLAESIMEALIMDRVDFVKLLLDQGVNMAEVLTYHRLEQLYNIKHSDAWLLRDAAVVLARRQIQGRMTLADVGATIDVLMGYGYRSNYKARAKIVLKTPQSRVLTPEFFGLMKRKPREIIPGGDADRFRYPFSELMIWAVLMQRHNMAKLLCSKGEETLAKTLIAIRLNRSIAFMMRSDLASETLLELKKNAKDFAYLSLELLEHCRQLDEVMTQQLLTYELENFSGKTCLSLAVSANHKHFVAHPCCQNLLDVLWMGGLKTRSTRPWKILLGLVFPPYAIWSLSYLSLEELNLQPQTEAELEERLNDYEDRNNSSGDLSPNADRASANEEPRGPMRFYSTKNGGSIRRNRSSVATIDATVRASTSPNNDRPFAAASFQNGSQDKDAKVTFGPMPPQSSISVISQQQYLNKSCTLSNGRSRSASMADVARKHGTKLSVKTRIDEFYNAPVTKFWLHTIGYIIFILCFCYTILTETYLHKAQWPEIYVSLYVATLFFDKLRELHSIDAHTLIARLEIYYLDIWNTFDAIAIFLFFVGLLLRWLPPAFEAGRAFWIISVVFFLIHVFDIFQANSNLATYIMMLQKMMKRMISFLIILGVVVAMYGIVLQATRFPFRNPEWDILKDIWIEPYLNLYGETYHEFVDTRQCDSEYRNSTDSAKPPCWCCTWIGPLAQAIYLVIANVLMLNLLVAVFNSVFEKVNHVSKALTRFQRYRLIVDYQMLPILPPPFIFLSHCYFAIRALIRWFQGRPFQARDPGLLKVVLTVADLASLHDFEEQARDEILELKESTSTKISLEDQMRSTTERIEAVQSTVDQLVLQQAAFLALMKDFELKLTSNNPTQNSLSGRGSFDLQPSRSFDRAVSPISDEQVLVEESSAKALSSRVFRRLRAISQAEEDQDYSRAARELLAVQDIDESTVSENNSPAATLRRLSRAGLTEPPQRPAALMVESEDSAFQPIPSIEIRRDSTEKQQPNANE